MSERKLLKWTGRILGLSATGIACWWCGMFTLSPNWKLYGLFALVGIMDSCGGWVRGYLKCAETHGISDNL